VAPVRGGANIGRNGNQLVAPGQFTTRLGRNSSFSFSEDAHMGFGPSNHFDFLLRNGAGGKFSINGDYLFRDQTGPGIDDGLWGILRVQ